MKVLTFEGVAVDLNKFELSVYMYIGRYGLCDHGEQQPFLSFDEIEVTGLSQNQIKGYLSQLLKKGVVYIGEDACGNDVFQTYMSRDQIKSVAI